jgi:hypothetical protein
MQEHASLFNKPRIAADKVCWALSNRSHRHLSTEASLPLPQPILHPLHLERTGRDSTADLSAAGAVLETLRLTGTISVALSQTAAPATEHALALHALPLHALASHALTLHALTLHALASQRPILTATGRLPRAGAVSQPLLYPALRPCTGLHHHPIPILHHSLLHRCRRSVVAVLPAT